MLWTFGTYDVPWLFSSWLCIDHTDPQGLIAWLLAVLACLLQHWQYGTLLIAGALLIEGPYDTRRWCAVTCCAVTCCAVLCLDLPAGSCGVCHVPG